MAGSDDSESEKRAPGCCGVFKRAPLSKSDRESTMTIEQKDTDFVYQKELSQKLTEGQVILLRGIVLPTCTRFAVNLKCGLEPTADIAFHFNPRVDREYVVRNSYIRGRWSNEEETTSLIKSEFRRNQAFIIAILITAEQFMVAVNDKHFCSYDFRVPCSSITVLDVTGDVKIETVDFNEWTIYPPERYEQVLFETGNNSAVESTGPQLVPYAGKLSKHFQTGWRLEIRGRVKLLPHSFSINLQQGAQLWPHPSIPLHLNPRFNWVQGADLFVRNAWIDGKWGSEERTRSFPFTPGLDFELVIDKDMDHFKVWVNGLLSGEFKFRGPADIIDSVYIKGDLVLKSVVMYDRQKKYADS